MIVKMVQNLENRMEVQINRLETRIDENFNWGEIFNNIESSNT